MLRCPNYTQAPKWARMECKSYNISEPEIAPVSEQANCRCFCAFPKQLKASAGNHGRPPGGDAISLVLSPSGQSAVPITGPHLMIRLVTVALGAPILLS